MHCVAASVIGSTTSPQRQILRASARFVEALFYALGDHDPRALTHPQVHNGNEDPPLLLSLAPLGVLRISNTEILLWVQFVVYPLSG